ncbi:MAG: outer membrane beta-barrel protein [Mucinivorans sp.]
MKTTKLLLIIALIVLGVNGSQAQKSSGLKSVKVVINDTTYYFAPQAVKSTTTIKPQEKPKNNPNKWRWDEGNFIGVNLFYNGLTGTGRGQSGDFMELDTKSIGVDINLIDVVIYSYRRFGVVTGLGIESNNFRFRNNISLTKNSDNMVVADYQYQDQGIKLEKSKLTTTYLNIPLLFQIKLGSKKSTLGGGWISAGVIAGLRLQNYTKVGLPDHGRKKDFSDLNMRNLHWGFMASIGYCGATITAKYYPHSIFRPGEGPDTQQFNIGIGYTF